MNSNLIYLTKTPLNVVYHKFIHKFYDRFKSKKLCANDSVSTTFDNSPYLKFNFSDSEFSFNGIELDQIALLENNKIIEKFASDFTNHIFKIFGHNISLDYFSLANGFEDALFNNNIEFNSFKHYISKYINQSNISNALKIAELLPDTYTPIDWQKDYISGFRWSESKWYKNISYGNISGADIKLPWEIGRLQFLLNFPILAFFNQDNTEKYFSEYKNIVLDFIAANPPRFGTQWMSSMDVALRAINLIVSLCLFNSLNCKIDAKIDKIIDQSLSEHMFHIINNLEWSDGLRGNHYLADICGLIFLSYYAEQCHLSNVILAFAINELISEIFYQFNDDGSNFEASTAYHAFTFEMIFTALYLVFAIDTNRFEQINNSVQLFTNKEFNSDFQYTLLLSNKLFVKKLKHLKYVSYAFIRSSDFINYLIKTYDFYKANLISDKHYNIIGDNDSGYVIRTTLWDKLSEYFIKAFHKKQHIHYNQYRYFNFLLNDTNFFDEVNKNRPKSLIQQANLLSFDNFGLYILQNKQLKLFIRAGNIGQNGKGGHSHNDQLSINLYINNLPVLVDSGTYCYTSNHKLRNDYRSIFSHNTLTVNNCEQNKWLQNNKNDLFWIAKERTKTKIISQTQDTVTAEHYAFKKPYRRTVRLSGSEIMIHDTCEAKGVKRILFHLHSTCSIDFANDQYAIISLSDDSKIKMSFDCTANIFVQEYYYSPNYLNKEPSNVIIAELSKDYINTLIQIINS